MASIEATLQLLLTALSIAAVACVSLLFFRRTWVRTSGKHHPLPPGPKPWPLIGNLAALGPLPHQALSKLSKIYGPLMYLRLGSLPTVIVSSPEMAEEVLKTHDRVFASRPRVSSCEIMAYNSQNFGFLPLGDQWREARKLFMSELMTAKRIESTQTIRKEEILFLLRSVLKDSGRDGGGKPVDMHSQLFHLSSNIVTRLMMSKRCFESGSAEDRRRSEEYQRTVDEAFRLFGVFNIGDYIPSLKRFDLQGYEKQMRATHQKLDVFLQHIIDSRLEDLQSKKMRSRNENVVDEDFLSTMLNRPMATNGRLMSHDKVKAMFVDVLMAGSETTSVTLEWALTELLKNPLVLEKCQEELDVVVGRARLVEESDLCHLPYLHAVVDENLRLHPAVPFMLPHESTEPCIVGGYLIPALSRVLVNIWCLGRDPSLWDRALEFDPQRFLQKVDDCDNNIQNFRMLPFGFGRRSCAGKAMALRIMPYTLAMILQCCNLALPTGSCSEDVDMSEKFGLVLTKKQPLYLVATPRLHESMIFG